MIHFARPAALCATIALWNLFACAPSEEPVVSKAEASSNQTPAATKTPAANQAPAPTGDSNPSTTTRSAASQDDGTTIEAPTVPAGDSAKASAAEQQEPVPVQEEPPPLVFMPPLPETPVAHVNGEPVPASVLLKELLDQHFQAAVQSIVSAKVADLELARSGIEIGEDGIKDEIQTMLERTSPGMTLESLEKGGNISLKHLMRQARMKRAWKEIYWKRQNVPEEQRHASTSEMMLGVFMTQAMQGYETRIRGKSPEPIPGTVAQITDKATNKEVVVTASEALDFLMGLSKLGGLLQMREQVIDRAILNHALAAAGKSVPESKVRAWVAEQRTKYQGIFDWDRLCQMKGTSPEREIERYRSILAYQELTGHVPTDEDLMEFLEEHKDYFLGKNKKVSHILVKTVDDETQLPIPGREEEAEEKIQLIHQKVVEGLDFGWMAETYSDDPVTARGKGRLGTPLRKWGGGVDQAFNEGAWKLENIGDISPPIKSAFGWHVIRLEEVSPPKDKEPNWKEPSLWDHIKDEYLTKKSAAFLAELKTKATVERVPPEKIFELKERTYFHEPGTTEDK